MGLGVNSLSLLSDKLAKSHNQFLMWLDMADIADSKESVLMCQLKAEEFANLSAHYRALIIKLVMHRNGYVQNSKGRYFDSSLD